MECQLFELFDILMLIVKQLQWTKEIGMLLGAY